MRTWRCQNRTLRSGEMCVTRMTSSCWKKGKNRLLPLNGESFRSLIIKWNGGAPSTCWWSPLDFVELCPCPRWPFIRCKIDSLELSFELLSSAVWLCPSLCSLPFTFNSLFLLPNLATILSNFFAKLWLILLGTVNERWFGRLFVCLFVCCSSCECADDCDRTSEWRGWRMNIKRLMLYYH